MHEGLEDRTGCHLRREERQREERELRVADCFFLRRERRRRFVSEEASALSLRRSSSSAALRHAKKKASPSSFSALCHLRSFIIFYRSPREEQRGIKVRGAKRERALTRGTMLADASSSPRFSSAAAAAAAHPKTRLELEELVDSLSSEVRVP